MTPSLFSPSSRWAASKVTAKIENTCIISVWKATVQHVWVVRCGIMCGHRLSWFLSRRTQISIFVCDVLDYQRPFTLQRFSQARVWLPLEEFQPCEEINGEQSETFFFTALVYLYCCYPGRSHKKSTFSKVTEDALVTAVTSPFVFTASWQKATHQSTFNRQGHASAWSKSFIE